MHRLVVPGWAMARPTIVAGALIPPEVAAVLEPLWQGSYGDRVIEFHRLTDVFVTGEGLVFDRNLDVVQPSITQHTPEQVREAQAGLQATLAAEAVPFQPGPTVLGGKIGMSNYGHWMVEMLPIAGLSLEWLAGGLWRIFLPHVYPWMSGVVLGSLAALGVPEAAILRNDGRAWRFEELIFVTGVSQHGQYYLPLAVQTMDRVGRGVASAGYDRVWVSREGERRSIAGEERLCAALAGRGWHILRPAGLSLADQIAACKGARHMAGVNGAGLTNMGFMASGGRLTDFMPAGMPDVFYWHLATHRGLDYREVRCPTTTDPAWFVPWDGTLLIEVEQIMALLDG